ncbi:ATP-dependent DNA ligase [Pontibacillus litoralis JSM 072002]|uniref:DNA ligase (ATP) n=2 Tax=Pontibacillus TaxID=289201 RepID=A0A0A5HU43_9BACI|nr:ATP-dependent DNA ligase [Pontibacillus litoralis JSM 072002]
MHMHKPMLPTLVDQAPNGEEWIYEVKYDGFRALLHWTKEAVDIWSRNENKLNKQFPEIIQQCKQLTETLSNYLPLWIDAELTILNTPFQANFSLIQQRNRLRNKTAIHKLSVERPATLMCFDIIHYKGQDVVQLPLIERKALLDQIIHTLTHATFIQQVPYEQDWHHLWKNVFTHLGEGVVAKRIHSQYDKGIRSKQWLKIKNWRTVNGFLSTYNSDNDYYTVGLYNGDTIEVLGSFKHGLSPEQHQTLKNFFYQHGISTQHVYKMKPSVCVEINCLQAKNNELREPFFGDFRFDLSPEACTKEQNNWLLALFPHVDISNPDKKLWKIPAFQKRDLLLYLREIAPYMLPHLQHKQLTIIRFPNGIEKESFFQKHIPHYAPPYVTSIQINEETFMACDNLETLIWLGNQAAIEYHIPFEQLDQPLPNEIVFDLDPPNRNAFSLAVFAAQLLKQLFDELHIQSFVKTSGNKGLQVHIPITKGSFTYRETRIFTATIAQVLVQQHPEHFTIERLKKKRGNRLYIDYVQHGEGKTLIAPYSPRATKEATVATPLYWHEITEDLSPTDFTINNLLARVKKYGCPLATLEQARANQHTEAIQSIIERCSSD